MSFFTWCLFWCAILSWYSWSIKSSEREFTSWVWDFVLSAALNSPPSNSLFPTITILPLILKWHEVGLETKQLSLFLSCAAVTENKFREMFGTYQTFNSFFWCHLPLMSISTGTVPSPTASKFPLAVLISLFSLNSLNSLKICRFLVTWTVAPLSTNQLDSISILNWLVTQTKDSSVIASLRFCDFFSDFEGLPSLIHLWQFFMKCPYSLQ